MELKIKAEFHNLIPPISPEEYQLLEESILEEGCRDAIIIWDDSIIDGHNRFEICQKHDIHFGTIDKSFENEDEAKVWIIRNQLARRNLPAHERIRLALLLKPAIEKKAKEHERLSEGKGSQTLANLKVEPIDTREEIAKLAGVSGDTVRKSEVIEKEATSEVKEAVRKGKVSINKAYKETRKPKKKIPQTKPLAIEQVNNEIKKTFEAFYDAVRKARKNHWKDSPKQAIKNLLENLEGLLI